MTFVQLFCCVAPFISILNTLILICGASHTPTRPFPSNRTGIVRPRKSTGVISFIWAQFGCLYVWKECECMTAACKTPVHTHIGRNKFNLLSNIYAAMHVLSIHFQLHNRTIHDMLEFNPELKAAGKKAIRKRCPLCVCAFHDPLAACAYL